MNKDIRTTADHLWNRVLTNRKPYRTAVQKIEARRRARIVDGRYVSDAPKSFHSVRHK